MDELREEVKEFLEKWYSKTGLHNDIKCAAMAYVAGRLENSRRPFTKVYDLVTEVVDDFVFREGK